MKTPLRFIPQIALAGIIATTGSILAADNNPADTNRNNAPGQVNAPDADRSTTPAPVADRSVAAADAGAINNDDSKFIKDTALHGKAEIQVAQIGMSKAQDPNVKAIAEKMAADHTALNEELSALAQSKNVELTSAANPDAAEKVMKLEKESGADFDKAFLKHMKDSHEKSVSSFEDASDDVKDAQLKAWVDQTLPKLKAHLAQVEAALEAK